MLGNIFLKQIISNFNFFLQKKIKYVIEKKVAIVFQNLKCSLQIICCMLIIFHFNFFSNLLFIAIVIILFISTKLSICSNHINVFNLTTLRMLHLMSQHCNYVLIVKCFSDIINTSSFFHLFFQKYNYFYTCLFVSILSYLF